MLIWSLQFFRCCDIIIIIIFFFEENEKDPDHATRFEFFGSIF